MQYICAFKLQKICLIWITTVFWHIKNVSGSTVAYTKELPHSKVQSSHVCANRNNVDILSWVVKIQYDPRRDSQSSIDLVADAIASNSDLVNRGQIGSLKGMYLFDHTLHNDYFYANTLLTQLNLTNASVLLEKQMPDHWGLKEITPEEWQGYVTHVKNHLEEQLSVEWYMQQHVYWRQKRSIQIDDPSFPKQWHLHNTKHKRQDINILRVWERNITGKGVVTAVVDDGLEWTNPDIQDNYFPEASYDLNDHDSDPMPSTKDKKNHHGTRCAGEIAAVANNVCGVGVAFQSRIAGLKVLDGPMTDSLEGVAFTKGKDLIDVYSCSWGPDDDGKTVDGPHYIALKALKEAVEYGRKGYGSIFVVASGNGGTVGDNCNFDGYANSIYTVTIGAVDELGAMPYYAEECASMLAVTFSSGSGGLRSIVTTDWLKVGGTGCTDRHTGTSAAAPLAAGMVALMLQARPCLTWRDIQHIIVMAAVKVDVDVAHWTQNKAGFHHSHKHGFGLMDAWRLVNAAKVWEPVPWLTLYNSEDMVENKDIPPLGKKLTLNFTVSEQLLDGYNLFTLEYVHIIVTLTHQQRGDLEIHLRCPSKTKSVLAATRALDTSKEGFDHWTFSTVRCWGEPPEGTYILTVQDNGKNVKERRGVLKSWQLKLYGSPMSVAEIQRRRRLVQLAADGSKLYDNFSLPCPPPPLRNKPATVISEKNLKVLVLASAFCMIMAVYESLEYLFCYDDEKKKHYEDLEQERQRRTRATQSGCLEGSQSESLRDRADSLCDSSSEGTCLLDTETIQLNPLPNGSEVNVTEGKVTIGYVPFDSQLSMDSVSDINNDPSVTTPLKKASFFQTIKKYFTKRPFRYKVVPGGDMDIKAEMNGSSSTGSFHPLLLHHQHHDGCDNCSVAKETDALISNERTSCGVEEGLTHLSALTSSGLVSNPNFVIDNEYTILHSDSPISKGQDEYASHDFTSTPLSPP